MPSDRFQVSDTQLSETPLEWNHNPPSGSQPPLLRTSALGELIELHILKYQLLWQICFVVIVLAMPTHSLCCQKGRTDCYGSSFPLPLVCQNGGTYNSRRVTHVKVQWKNKGILVAQLYRTFLIFITLGIQQDSAKTTNSRLYSAQINWNSKLWVFMQICFPVFLQSAQILKSLSNSPKLRNCSLWIQG